MKKYLVILILVLVCSCSKLSSIFDGSDNNAIAPIEWSGTNASEATLPISSFMISRALYNAGATYSPNDCGKALILNDDTYLTPFELEGSQVVWPVIDFSEYSLVIGFFESAVGNTLAHQRVTQTNSVGKLYLRMQKLNGCAFDVSPYYFYGLYPKLKDGPLTVVRYDED